MTKKEPHLLLKSRIMSYGASGRDTMLMRTIFFYHIADRIKSTPIKSYHTCIIN